MPELVICDGLMVFHCLLNDHSLGELDLLSVRVKRIGCSSWNLSFSISEPVLDLLNRPFIVSVLLLSWSESSMSFVVHAAMFGLLLFFSSLRIKNLLGGLRSNSGNSVLEILFLNNSR